MLVLACYNKTRMQRCAGPTAAARSTACVCTDSTQRTVGAPTMATWRLSTRKQHSQAQWPRSGD